MGIEWYFFSVPLIVLGWFSTAANQKAALFLPATALFSVGRFILLNVLLHNRRLIKYGFKTSSKEQIFFSEHCYRHWSRDL